jgi:hypothetical protein
MKRRLALSLSAALSFAAACGDSGTDPNGGTKPTATLVLVMAVPEDVLVRIAHGARFYMQSGAVSGQIAVPSGNVRVSLAAGPTLIGTVRIVTFEAGRHYILVATDSTGVVVPWIYGDSNATPVAGKSKLRVIHAAGLAPPVDIWRTQPDWPTPIRIMFPFPFGAMSPYLLSDPGDWSIVVTPEGQTDTLFATGSFTVGDGKLVTVVVMDSTATGGVSAIVIPDN